MTREEAERETIVLVYVNQRNFHALVDAFAGSNQFAGISHDSGWFSGNGPSDSHGAESDVKQK